MYKAKIFNIQNYLDLEKDIECYLFIYLKMNYFKLFKYYVKLFTL